MTIPQQMAGKTAADLAAIARTTDSEHLRQAAIRELEIRAERWDRRGAS